VDVRAKLGGSRKNVDAGGGNRVRAYTKKQGEKLGGSDVEEKALFAHEIFALVGSYYNIGTGGTKIPGHLLSERARFERGKVERKVEDAGNVSLKSGKQLDG